MAGFRSLEHPAPEDESFVEWKEFIGDDDRAAKLFDELQRAQRMLNELEVVG